MDHVSEEDSLVLLVPDTFFNQYKQFFLLSPKVLKPILLFTALRPKTAM